MNVLYGLFAQFVPVSLGIFLFFAIRKIHLGEHRIVIDTQVPEIKEIRANEYAKIRPRKGLSEDFIKNELITGGKFNGRAVNYKKEGFELLGFLDVLDLDKLTLFLRRNPKEKLLLFVEDYNTLFDKVLGFGKNPTLLAYMLDYEIEIVPRDEL